MFNNNWRLCCLCWSWLFIIQTLFYSYICCNNSVSCDLSSCTIRGCISRSLDIIFNRNICLCYSLSCGCIINLNSSWVIWRIGDISFNRDICLYNSLSCSCIINQTCRLLSLRRSLHTIFNRNICLCYSLSSGCIFNWDSSWVIRSIGDISFNRGICLYNSLSWSIINLNFCWASWRTRLLDIWNISTLIWRIFVRTNRRSRLLNNLVRVRQICHRCGCWYFSWVWSSIIGQEIGSEFSC